MFFESSKHAPYFFNRGTNSLVGKYSWQTSSLTKYLSKRTLKTHYIYRNINGVELVRSVTQLRTFSTKFEDIAEGKSMSKERTFTWTKYDWKDFNVRKMFMESIKDKYQIKSHDDWYKITITMLRENSGSGLLSLYNNSISKILSSIYPDEPEWLPWKFASVADGFWNVKENVIKYVKWLEQQLGINHLDEWYRIRLKDVVELDGGSLLTLYNNSLQKLLQELYPDHNWRSWKFDGSVSKAFWDSKENRKEFLEFVKVKKNVLKDDDWYNVTKHDIKELGGRTLIRKFGSVVNMLSDVYPEKEWKIWKSKYQVKSSLENKKDRQEYLLWLASELDITHPEGWYQITGDQLDKKDIRNLIARPYNGSLYSALQDLFPDIEWLPWRFAKKPSGFWVEDNGKNRKKFLDWCGKQLGIINWKDWYNVKVSEIENLGGRGMMNYYSDSLCQALKDIYCEHPWEMWRFSNVTVPEESLSDFVKHIGEQLRIREMDDWYRISNADLLRVGGYYTILKNGGIRKVLSKIYPHYKWITEKFDEKAKRASQRWLHVLLQEVFPDKEILEDHPHPQLKSSDGTQLQIDLYIPELSLAFEYQGEQHYTEMLIFGSLSEYQRRDQEKKSICNELGINLIEIPYWWDRNVNSLLGTLHNHRPDLVATSHKPIPDKPPTRNDNENDSIQLEIPNEWDKSIDVTNWWITEKRLGALRTSWDPKTSKLYNRRGVPLDAPLSFLSKFPPVKLDGELWFPKTDVRRLVRIPAELWDNANYLIWDVLEQTNDTLYERWEKAKKMSLPRGLQLVEYRVCKGNNHFEAELKNCDGNTFAGLLLRNPHSVSQPGRNKNFFVATKERFSKVRFIKVNPNNLLLCEQVDGVNCMVSCPLHVAKSPPSSGTVLTVMHDGVTSSGKLLRPIYRGLNPTDEWDEIVQSNKQ